MTKDARRLVQPSAKRDSARGDLSIEQGLRLQTMRSERLHMANLAAPGAAIVLFGIAVGGAIVAAHELFARKVVGLFSGHEAPSEVFCVA